MAGATVRAESIETGGSRITVTNKNGVYRLSSVKPGTYTLTAELTGFKTFVDRDLKLSVGETLTIDISLEIGDITQAVTVTSETVGVQKAEGRLSHLVQAAEIRDLPVNGRDTLHLALTLPGMAPTMSRVAQSGPNYSVNGQRHRGNNFVLDGTDNNYVGVGGVPLISPQVEAVEEFRVITNNFSAEHGRNSGAVINVLTKSGTNELRGSVYWYHRNAALDAREFLDVEKAPLVQHTFGFTAGGPIVRNKLFIFGGYEGFRQTSGETTRFTAETPELIAFVNQTRPDSLAAQLFRRFPMRVPIDCSIPGSNCRDVGSPAAGVSKKGPADDIVDLGSRNIFIARKDRNNEYNFRIDFNPTDVDSLYGRFSRELVPTHVDPLWRPGISTIHRNTDQAITVAYTRVLSSAVVNELRLGWNHRGTIRFAEEGTFDVPRIRVSDFRSPFGIGVFGNNGIPRTISRHTYQLSNQTAWTHGNHSLKFGGEFRHGQENSDLSGLLRGGYDFDNVLDFIDDEAEAQGNSIDPSTGEPVGTPRHFRVNEWALYVQDDWKTSPRLTLNLGLRYENFRPPWEIDGIQSNIVLGPGDNLGQRYAAATLEVYPKGSDIYAPDNNNFAPRFGLAWDPKGDGKWAVRGGWGVSYNRIFMNITSNIKFNPPFSQTIQADQNNGLPITYAIPTQIHPDLISGFVPPRYNPNLLDPGLRTSYVYSFFFGVQHEIARGWVVEANYVSTAGRKLYAQEKYNRFTGDLLDGIADGLNPAWNIGSDDYLTSKINQAYHSGQFRVQKRFSGGLGFRANYTWAKNIDSDTDVFGAKSDEDGSSIVEDQRADRGLSSVHIGNRFTATWIWALPWGRVSDSWVVRNVLGNWQVNGLVALQDGAPTTVTARGSSFRGRGDFNGDGFKDDRPMVGSLTAKDIDPRDALNPDTPLFGGRNGVHDIFPRPAPGTNGNLGRNTFFYHGFASVDLSLFKNIPMRWFGGETAMWQFRAEFFNLFNRVNPDVWEENLASGSFGETSSVFDAREIQFALKFLF